MTKHLITHLRHVDIAMPDLDRQVDFYRNLWGLTDVARDSGVHFLAAEGSPEQYIMRLRRDDLKRLDLVAFGAATPADVDELTSRLVKDGVTLVHEPRALDTPGGGYGVRFFDCDGRVVEVSADVGVRVHRRIEERESIPVRLSHFVVNSPTPEATVAWYVRHLGFRLTDSLALPHMGELMWFLRCNEWHHSFAVSRGPHVSFHHASFEMRGIDEYMRGTGRMLRNGVEKVWGPGRHKAGDNTFSYFLDPVGNTVEYTTELELVDEDTWHPTVFDATSEDVADQWGTANPMNEIVASRQFNDPDKGVFIAPPI
ncbi:VOC family protein [Acrocarpospora macrocephala]|uniref:Oxidoreductase n=1 Tax=Acrocarpospora macrocephala TaxID=150177 RepID=A0A5M3WIS3_9ACTN|nr:VOC family protein [Acrocarpospora macrocephala]GES09067.1 oxidoreductase [Acrocarpospora macrocephala]